jgi:hypothetical protein
MSAYALNKLLREVNRNPQVRESFFADRAAISAKFELSDAEREAIVHQDVGALYRLGAHGLILRPFTILQQMSEPDYLAAIRS